jgi:Na+/H+ antiporter NhaD/arsenite permease-like protein
LKRKIFTLVAGVAAVLGALSLTSVFAPNQVISLTVFVGIILSILLFWRLRVVFALFGVFVLLASGLLDIPHFIEFAGLDIVTFLIGMMIVIGFLEERHFFEYLLERIVGVSGSSFRLLFILMSAAAFSAALVDEVTSILFMTALVLRITGALGVSFIPLLILVVFATNIGSSATVVGNPVGVMIALRAGLGFSDFLRWATPISLLTLFMTVPIGYFYFRGYFQELDRKLKEAKMVQATVAEGINNGQAKLDRVALLLFLGTIGLLVAHTPLEDALGLEKNTLLLGAPMLGAGVALILEGQRARELVERRVDWWTLLFFLLFFSTVGTLKYVGVTGIIARTLYDFAGGNQILFLTLTGYIAGFLSAFMDNILAIATVIAVAQDLQALGINVAPLWWILLFAGTLMGNLTIIGSTANIIAIGIVERQRVGHITLREWVKIGAPVSLLTFSVALLLIILQLPLLV